MSLGCGLCLQGYRHGGIPPKLAAGVINAIFVWSIDQTGGAMASGRKRFIVLDTDAGCDDAMAMLLALHDETSQVLAFNTVFGNAPISQATGALLSQLLVDEKTDEL